MIQLSEVTKAFGVRTLLDRVTWQIGDGDRVGLCGPNGAGKTTLLKMLAGLDEPDGGVIAKPADLTIGYLPQDGLTHAGRTVFEEAAGAFQPLLDMKAEMTDIEHRLADPSLPEAEHDGLLSRYADLQDRFRLGDGYSMDLRIATVLRGLGFSPADADRPAETFSGGWQMRIALAKLLLGRPNLLLLDEPTNHLDLDARNWLEEYLAGYPYAVILVSHDRYFLDAVVTRITDLNLRVLTDYVGNYTKYVAQRDAMLERLRQAKREQDEEVARVKMFIDRFRYQATKAAQVQSRIKLLEKVVPIEVPPERKRIHFTFPTCQKSGRTVLELSGVHKAYGSLTVFERVNLHIERGDRLALVGPNGAGKSTLMRMLVGEEAPDAGTRTLGHNVVAEYFAQDEATRLDPALTVYETLEAGSATDMVPGHPEHPGRVPLFRRRHLQEGGGAVRWRTHQAGRGPHAAATVERAAARRADQPPRPRFEGRAAGSAGGLWRHADPGIARPLLRGAAGDQDRGGGPRRRPGLSRHLHRVSLEQGEQPGCRTGALGQAARRAAGLPTPPSPHARPGSRAGARRARS